jgi:hypothetical protein
MLAIQTRLLQEMSAERKLEVAQQLRETAWALKAVGVRRQYPDLSEHEVQERVRQIFLNARS